MATAGARSDRMRSLLIAVALVSFAALLIRNGYSMLHFASIAVPYPFDLDYGEGIVWQQAREIAAGRGYAPLGVFPAIVFHYPPVYHLTSLALARIAGLDELVAGRLVSVCSTIATMGFCALLTGKMLPAGTRRGVAIIVMFAAPLIFISFAPVMMWFVFMRVDMLAGALSLAGLLLAIYALKRPVLIVGAAVLFVLSIYTKQTSIAAPAAAFLMLILMRPRRALVLLATCLALGLVALVCLSWASDGRFLEHILGYNLNRYSNANLPGFKHFVLAYCVFFGVAVFGVVMVARGPYRSARAAPTLAEWRYRHADDPRLGAVIAMLLFFVLKLAMVPMIFKSGASFNYLIEWLSSVAIFAAIGILPVVVAGFDTAAPVSPLLAVAAWLLPLQALHPGGWDLTRDSADRQAAALKPLVAQIRSARKPVISDDMILLIRAGQPVRLEPAIVAELGSSGRYDDDAFARLIRRHSFAFFITQAQRGDPLFDDRYNPQIADALYQAYPTQRKVAGLIVHLP